MRYYRIDIAGQTGVYSSLVNGQFDPGALNVEMDIIQAPTHVPDGGSWVRIWGIPIATVSQSTYLNGKSIAIYGGMSKGLPLANPAQQGLLVQGLIQQAVGNWTGPNLTLQLYLSPGTNAPGTAATATTAGQSKTAGGTSTVGPQTPLNLIFNWQPGTTLATAIQNTLSTALPGFPVKVGINATLTNPRKVAIAGYYQNLAQFGEFLRLRSIDMISANPYGGTGYAGVQMFLDAKTITVFDGSGTPSSPKQIAFTDLVGQPGWQSARQVQVTTVMRGDLNIGDTITLPNTLVNVTGGLNFAPNQTRDNSIFQGTFQIAKLRHIGNFRQPHGESWITIIDVNARVTTPSPTPAGNVDIESIDITPQ